MKRWRPNRIRSFYYAFTGIRYSLKNEPNFRFQLIFGVLVFIAAIYFPVSTTEWLFVISATGAVWSAELFNTAVEKVCDRFLDEEDRVVKIIKDSAAAAVMITSITAAVIGIIIFIPYILNLGG